MKHSNPLMAKALAGMSLNNPLIEVDKAKELLRAEKWPDLDSVKESCIKQLERYINSRGSIHEGEFSPSFMTKIFRDKKATVYKVSKALDLIEDIRNVSSPQEIRELINQACADPQLLKKTSSSGLEYSLGKCIFTVTSNISKEMDTRPGLDL